MAWYVLLEMEDDSTRESNMSFGALDDDRNWSSARPRLEDIVVGDVWATDEGGGGKDGGEPLLSEDDNSYCRRLLRPDVLLLSFLLGFHLPSTCMA
jgi:hypothetical protein